MKTKPILITICILVLTTGVFLFAGSRTSAKFKRSHANDLFDKQNDSTYSPITLKAFKKAKQLRSKYDSVIWFSHINEQTYFYVVKGSWDIYQPFKNSAKTYKMGLISPQLKVIIPVEYDLIHNLDATFNSLIEVEKNGKKGFYNLSGKIVVPVIYDEILPLNSKDTLAVLRKDDDDYWLNKDYHISAKDAGIKIADILPKIKGYQGSDNYDQNTLKYITEYNSKYTNGCIYIAPSYLVHWGILPTIESFKNPLRKIIEYGGDATSSYNVKFVNVTDNNNWLQTAFYSIRDYFLNGRIDFYDEKSILIADKKRNKTYSYRIPYVDDLGVKLSGGCPDYSLRSINDSLLEVKATSWRQLLSKKYNVNELPLYHYLQIKNGRISELPSNRMFSCTKYVKLDDSFINGCYVVGDEQISHLPMEVLEFMKMEIYADYNYRFPDEKWMNAFSRGKNASVDDSLTTIDKYNINWINQKLRNYQKN